MDSITATFIMLTVPPFKYIGEIKKANIVVDNGTQTVNLEVIADQSEELRMIIGLIKEKIICRRQKYAVSGKFKL